MWRLMIGGISDFCQIYSGVLTLNCISGIMICQKPAANASLARFPEISSSQSTATACMDLRDLQVLDSAGFPVTNSLDRGTVLIEIEDGLISKFELLGSRC